MTDAHSKERMVNNEAAFRGMNQRALAYVNELNDIADEDHASEFLRYDDSPLHFLCECADENCRQRVAIRPSSVKKIHANNRHFVVLPNHQVSSIEKVVKKLRNYYIVEKTTEPPRIHEGLQKTALDNS